MPVKILTQNVEFNLRINNDMKCRAVGEAAEKAAGMPKGSLSYMQSYRLKNSALENIHGSLEYQFGTLVSRLEQVKACDPDTNITIKLSATDISTDNVKTFVLRFRGYAIVHGS